mgnify:CR=1 FL=1
MTDSETAKNNSDIDTTAESGFNLDSLCESDEDQIVKLPMFNLRDVHNPKIELKQVYRVLNGEHGASLGTIISIAKGLDIEPKELFDFKFDLEKE